MIPLDIDECANNSVVCMEKFQCVNTEGNYSCICNNGFFLSPENVTCCKLKDMYSSSYKLSVCLWFYYNITFVIVCNDGDLRLINGSTPREGRIEFCRNNMYGTVCDDQWDVLDARVACRQLGFSSSGKQI